MAAAYCSARAVSCDVVRARIWARVCARSQLLAEPTKFLTGGLGKVGLHVRECSRSTLIRSRWLDFALTQTTAIDMKRTCRAPSQLCTVTPVTTTARIPAVPFVRHILPDAAGTYVTENRFRCLLLNAPIRGIRIATGISEIRFAPPGVRHAWRTDGRSD